ncbi:uncharacterized protein B0H64DRAFT_412340 [Chaetomium fimeti]|uniref:Uncharacterized protein n=1 Tax=Chaetomium fimeti TaxID=1854472 RepID=A0AAE0LMS7_9PEZI|nr:hypothetical protein B0H64DRAFT_412340 [Chaetomium fimeti]
MRLLNAPNALIVLIALLQDETAHSLAYADKAQGASCEPQAMEVQGMDVRERKGRCRYTGTCTLPRLPAGTLPFHLVIDPLPFSKRPNNKLSVGPLTELQKDDAETFLLHQNCCC